jgi:phosphoribosylaminoimidazolecarboxamide formyltransferase / IMP cyclohydrolase
MAGKENALISVYNKDGLEEFADGLSTQGFNIYASGGTAKRIGEAGIEVTDVAELVGGGSILGHRVVTLSREVHAALLAQKTPEDLAELERLGIPLIDLVAVDMYPLRDALANPDSTERDIIEQTDIGGPTMLRSAAKGRRIVLSRVEQRPEVLKWLADGRPDEEEFRRQLAGIAELEAAAYILESAKYIGGPAVFGFIGEKIAEPLYGENPWQGGAGIYMERNGKNPLAYNRYEQHGGIETSYNNVVEFAERMTQTITHIAAGFEHNFGEVPALALGVKHGNACGAAYADTPQEVIKKMLEGDERAIFGGSVMLNFEIDKELAELLMSHDMKDGQKRLLDIVIAAGVTDEAKEILQRKTGKLRLLTNPALASLGMDSLDTAQRSRYIPDGMAVQDNYTYVPEIRQAELLAGGWMSPEQERDLVLAWAVGSTSNSNTITIVENGMVIGNGVGQQDRVGAAELALKRAVDADHDSEGAVAYSDSFFPYPDGAEVLADAGVRVILATSGSINDSNVADALRAKGIQSFLTFPDKTSRGFFGH